MPVSFHVRQVVYSVAIAAIFAPASFAQVESVTTARTDRASATQPPLQVIDVALAERGLLTGRVLDSSDRPKAHAEVTVYSAGQAVATSRTDVHGEFAVAGVRGGVHQVVAANSAVTCRLWAPGTAPPAAAAVVEIVDDPNVVRGQWGPPPLTNNFIKKAKVMATNPFVVGGVVAAAVAIPVAIHNADEDDGPSS